MSSFIIGNPDLMFMLASQETAAANNYISQLANAAGALQPPNITPVFPNVGAAPPVSIAPLPSMQTVTWQVPNLPAAFSGSLSVDSLLPAPFDGAPPVLQFGTAPAAFSQPVPASPATNLNFDFPKLSLQLPTAPSLLSMNTYSFGGVNLPTIDSTVPILDIGAPSVVPYIPGAQYTSSLLASCQSTLQSRILNGGTGLPPPIEQGIWDRAREREFRAQADAIAELERMGDLGYAFPPGVFLDARIKIQTETQYTTAGLSRDVAIKQAELEMQNILHSIDSAIQLEGKLIEYTNSTEQRMFEASKYATEAGISIYNAKVRAYEVYLDAYKLKVAIYEAQIRGELAKVEAYKAEVEAERAKAEINLALVQSYKTQVDAALANVEVYKAQLSAIQTKAEIEKIKVEIFGEQVKAYVGQINAYTANVEAYKAGVQAETAKAETYRSQVEAYGALVTASVKEIEAKIEEYKGLLQGKITEYEGYKAAVTGAAEQARAISYYNTSQSEVYRAEVQGISSYNEILTKQWQVAYEQAQRVAEIGVAAAKANGELYINTRNLALEASKTGAMVAAQLGAAALNAVHWSSSTSDSSSTSTATSTSDARSVSSSTSTNYNYNSSV